MHHAQAAQALALRQSDELGQCDAGFVSDAAASQCRPSSDNGGGTPAPSTTTSGSSTNTMIIIAAAAGGGVLALIIGIAACMNFGR